MKRKMDDLAENVEDAVLLLETFLEFDVLVPERVSQEILATAFRATLKESNVTRLEESLT